MNGLGIANYQTKPHPARYSETEPNWLTLELLWILRALLDASALFITILLAAHSSAANGSPNLRQSCESAASSEQLLKNSRENHASLRSGFLILVVQYFSTVQGRPFKVTIAA